MGFVTNVTNSPTVTSYEYDRPKMDRCQDFSTASNWLGEPASYLRYLIIELCRSRLDLDSTKSHLIWPAECSSLNGFRDSATK